MAYSRINTSIAILAVVMLAGSYGSAQPPIAETECVKLSKAGLYEIDAAHISPSVPGDCVVITASNVILNLNGSVLNGKGTGAGVHVMSSASNVLVEGRGAIISGFNEGIEIDGSKDIAENFTVTGNYDAGVLLNNAKQTKLNNLNANDNQTDGVRISKGSYNSVSGAANPGVDGAVTLDQNARYGLWISASSYNTIGGFTAMNNSVAGIYIGCSTAFPNACSKTTKSNYNSVFNGQVIAVNGGSQPYGVAIDSGDGNNRVANVSSSDEDIAAVIDDFIDQNVDCGTNDWFGNDTFSGKTIPAWEPAGCIE